MRVLLGRSPYRKLEKAIGYSFRHRSLLTTALTHRSFHFENRDEDSDNQRMEFLGDAVLGFVSGAYLYAKYEEFQEGALTRIRSQLTSGKTLAHIARKVEVGEHLRLGKGEANLGGLRRASNLTDALEAVLGAAYLDGGVRAVEKIFKHVFLPELDEADIGMWTDNPKGQLQQMAQSKWGRGPEYRTLHQDGPAHARVFTAEVLVGGTAYGRGHGNSKREAETQAAMAAVRRLSSHHDRRHHQDVPVDWQG